MRGKKTVSDLTGIAGGDRGRLQRRRPLLAVDNIRRLCGVSDLVWGPGEGEIVSAKPEDALASSNTSTHGAEGARRCGFSVPIWATSRHGDEVGEDQWRVATTSIPNHQARRSRRRHRAQLGRSHRPTPDDPIPRAGFTMALRRRVSGRAYVCSRKTYAGGPVTRPRQIEAAAFHEDCCGGEE